MVAKSRPGRGQLLLKRIMRLARKGLGMQPLWSQSNRHLLRWTDCLNVHAAIEDLAVLRSDSAY